MKGEGDSVQIRPRETERGDKEESAESVGGSRNAVERQLNTITMQGRSEGRTSKSKSSREGSIRFTAR